MPGSVPSPLSPTVLGDAHSCAHLVNENIEAPLNPELFSLNSEEPRLQSRLPDSRTSRLRGHSVFPFAGNLFSMSMHPSLWD